MLEFDFKDTKGPRIVSTKRQALDPTITGHDGSAGPGVRADTSEPSSAIDNVNDFKSMMPTLPPPMFSRQVAPHSFL